MKLLIFILLAGCAMAPQLPNREYKQPGDEVLKDHMNSILSSLSGVDELLVSLNKNSEDKLFPPAERMSAILEVSDSAVEIDEQGNRQVIQEVAIARTGSDTKVKLTLQGEVNNIDGQSEIKNLRLAIFGSSKGENYKALGEFGISHENGEDTTTLSFELELFSAIVNSFRIDGSPRVELDGSLKIIVNEKKMSVEAKDFLYEKGDFTASLESLNIEYLFDGGWDEVTAIGRIQYGNENFASLNIQNKILTGKVNVNVDLVD